MTSFCKVYINKVFFHLLKYYLEFIRKHYKPSILTVLFFSRRFLSKRIMIILVYLRNLLDNLKVITKNSDFLHFFNF